MLVALPRILIRAFDPCADASTARRAASFDTAPTVQPPEPWDISHQRMFSRRRTMQM